jgi:AcrR family transcriptional regulator
MAKDSTTPSAPKRPGRRPGSNRTRQLVLDAARARFAEDGYAGTTIRSIAADADVDSSLVMQYFSSKEELFGAVMSITPHALSRFAEAFYGPQDGVGERAVRAFLDIWEGDPADSEPLLAMLRAAMSNEQATSQLREFLQARITELPASWGQDEHEAALRIGLASSMLVGLIVGRRIVRVPALADESAESLIHVLAPALQSILVDPGR